MDGTLLIAASAAIVLLLGLGHLVLTYRGPKLQPRDRSVREAMESTAPVITSRTTIWKMWIGFNVTHSMCAILFGLVWGWLALPRPDVLLASPFLEALGAAVLVGFVVLAGRYWFLTPFAGAIVALALYLTGLALASG